jgi:hypothetical protein
MITRRNLLLTGSLPALPASRRAYLPYIVSFADTLLDKGLDRAGPRSTPMWAGVIDARDFSQPAGNVPPVPGIRPNDRAVGGANLYHDAVTLRVFLALSSLTGKPWYAQAAREYIDAFFRRCQNPETGFLAWGEHLYYDFKRDTVAAERKWHEFLGSTPPWPELWDVNPRAVERAVAAIRYHFYAGDPKGLFNRHAAWDQPEYQRPGGQPWIKHSGIFAYSFAFLYSKTTVPRWLDWIRGPANLYWQRRNPSTNLTLSCIDDPRIGSRNASSEMVMLAYWLYKASQICPQESYLRDRALAYVLAWDRFAWHPARGGWRALLTLDGKPAGDQLIDTWTVAYGEPSVLRIGRIAAYLARTERDASFVDLARRAANLAGAIPSGVATEALGFALNLHLDLFDLTKENHYLEEAVRCAEVAISKLWMGDSKAGLFVRAAGDPYYESKIGTGDLLAGILRLSMRLEGIGKNSEPDWSF